MSGRAGELGELDPFRVRCGVRAPPRQDRHLAPAPGGHLQAGEEHRVGEYSWTAISIPLRTYGSAYVCGKRYWENKAEHFAYVYTSFLRRLILPAIPSYPLLISLGT